MKSYGHFENNEYVITEKKTPRHWYNYYFNDTYNAFASQVGFGEGFCQDYLGNRIYVVKDRCVYICDKKENTYHLATGIPMNVQFDKFNCRHGLGYSTITTEKKGIQTKYTIFVPESGNFEEWQVEITNLRNEKANLSCIAFANTDCDGQYTPQGYNSCSATYDKHNNSIIAKCLSTFDNDVPQRCYAYMTSSEDVSAYDTRKNAFIGVYGNKEYPEALEENNGCLNSDTCVEKICFALENKCSLESGETKVFCYRIGFTNDYASINYIKSNITPEMSKSRLEKIKNIRLSEIDDVTIQTPDENLNFAFNGFYKYATVMASRWARVRHNGYRDMASDTECLGSFNPNLAWIRFKHILEYQYSNGYCPRTIIDGKICPNNFSDCAVWITFTAYALIMELGNIELLQEKVKFNDGSEATVFEHLHRAVGFLYNFQGMHGLIKIWGGDWYDGMNRAGLQEKGVSIWLSIAWYRANNMFIELSKMFGEIKLVESHTQMGKTMKERIEKFGWDGDYYLAAINDLGKKIGSHESDEGKMYLNSQLWAILSGITDEQRQQQLINKIDDYLETPLGTLINNPGYTKYDPYIGNMTAQPIGTLINRAVYLHPMAWKLAVECIVKRPEKLQMTLKKILPWHTEYAPTCGEPYILYNFYYGPESGYRYATPGQSWRTATTQWVVKSLINFVFGLKPDIQGLRINPCLPPEWKTCSITKKFRNCMYHISYEQNGEKKILADGIELKDDMLPYKSGSTIYIQVYCK